MTSSIYIPTVVLKLERALESLTGFVKTQVDGPYPEFLKPDLGWSLTINFEFLSSCLMMTMLLV